MIRPSQVSGGILNLRERFSALSRPRKFAFSFGIAAFAMVLWFFLRRDAYIVDAVQTYGSAILGVKVKLKSAHLDLADQSMELRGLWVGNPEGFKSPSLMQLGRVFVKLDVSSLARDVVLVREIVLEKPEITYERIRGFTNVDAIQRNANRFVGAGEALPPMKKHGKNAPEKRWIVSHLVMSGGRATVLTDQALVPNMAIALPDMHLRDIGKRANGATTADATQQVMAAMTASVSNAVGNAIGGAVKGVAKGVGQGAKAIGGLFEGIFKKKK